MSSRVAYKLYTAGFGPAMVPVTAPGGQHVSAIQAKDMGKCPGKMRKGGYWYPQAVGTAQCASLEEAIEWDVWGANVGLKLGGAAKLIAVDNDIDDPIAARTINALIQAKLGPNHPYRGVDDPNHLRLLYPFRIIGPLPKGTTLVFEKDGVKVKIDLLSDGKQFVTGGKHARTGKDIIWNVDITQWMDGVDEFPEYTLQFLMDLLEEITKAMEAMGWTKVSGAVSASGADTGTKDRKTATEYELNRWLALIPNTDDDTQFEDRNDWVGLAHAIHGASGGADWGRELWLTWCNQRNQEPGEAEKVWDTLKGDGRVGLDFIREKARERNARLAAQLDFEMAPSPDSELIDALAAEAEEKSVWPRIIRRYVFVVAQDKYYDLVTGESMTRSAFDTVLGKYSDRMKAECFPDDNTVRVPSQMFSKHPDTEKLDNFTYWPGQPRLTKEPLGQRYLVNRWRTAQYTHRMGVTENDIRPWLDLVELICKDKAAAKRLIKYFAFMIKRPGEKANNHPLIMTKPGLGKDTMLLAVIYAVGQRNAREVTSDDLAKDWTDFLEHRLVYVSETRQHSKGNKSSHDVMNDLKPYLVDKPEFVQAHHKGKGKYPVPNTTMWVFFSNETHPLYLAEGDRRIWVIKNLDTVPPPPDYYEKLQAWLAKNIDLVASYLMDYPLTAADIADFKGPAPMNDAKRDLIAANRDPVEATLSDIIDEARQGVTFPTCIATPRDLLAELNSRLNHKVSDVMLARHLRALGGFPVVKDQNGGAGAGVVKVAGVSHRLWVVAPTDAAGRDYTKLTPAEAGQVYMGAKWPTYTTQTGVPLTAIDGGDEI
jgi:hypothetical protein